MPKIRILSQEKIIKLNFRLKEEKKDNKLKIRSKEIERQRKKNPMVFKLSLLFREGREEGEGRKRGREGEGGGYWDKLN